MALKKPKDPAEELNNSLQGDQSGDNPVVTEPAKTGAAGELVSEPAAQTEETEEKKPRRTRKTAAKKTQSDTEAASGENSAATGVKRTPKSKVAPQSVLTDEPVISIGERRSAQTESDKAKDHLLDLLESYKAGRILTGVIQGVEKTSDDIVAVLYHGDFKVIIPAKEAIIPPDDYRGRDPLSIHRYMLTKRLGAEVDYIVKGMDPETGLAVASRLDAMKARRKQYYLTRDRDGNNLLYEGVLAEGRVTSVIKAGIFVDLFGVEVYISMRELSYQRWIDASEYYHAGQRVIVRIMSVDRSDRENIKVKASVKRAKENPYEKALKRYVEGNLYVGTVSMVDENGVFVAMDGGIDCLCEYPRRGRPPIGSRVTVRIVGINRSSNRIWGAITHTTTSY